MVSMNDSKVGSSIDPNIDATVFQAIPARHPFQDKDT